MASPIDELTRLRVATELRALLMDLEEGAGRRAKKSLQASAARWLALSPVASRGEQTRVVGDATSMPPVAYHLDCLMHLDWDAKESAAKIRWHLKLLGMLFDDIDENLAPLVSVVVLQAGNSSFERALASLARQTYRAVEVIVAGREKIDLSVCSYPVKQVGARGSRVEAARDAIALAEGDFVQFLEGDEALSPETLARKVRSWGTIPDARVCLSPYVCAGSDALEAFFAASDSVEGERGLLGDPLLASASRFPYPLGGMMVPRWYLHKIGGMPTDGAATLESRLWFRLARGGAKCVLAEGVTLERGERPQGKVKEQLTSELEATLLAAEELADQPRMYRYVAPLLGKATWLLDRAFEEEVTHGTIEAYHDRIVRFEGNVGEMVPSASGLTGLLLDQLVFMLRQKRRLASDPTRPMLRLWDEREDQLLERLAGQPTVTGSDLRRWLPELPPRPFAELSRSERAALKFALEQLQVTLVLGELPIRFRTLERVAADYPGHPYERYWHGAFRLARLVGDETARSVFRQKLFRSGWQLLGRARRVVSESPTTPR